MAYYNTSKETVAAESCITHLKLLHTISKLRHSISTCDHLFGIHNREASSFPGEKSNLALARIREKRWAVYVVKAVDRFISWWQTCVPEQPFFNGSDLFAQSTTAIPWTVDTMPPLDVLMVWHAYMLHPRAFLEDCLRLSKMGLWAQGLPWEVIASSFDEKGSNYHPTAAAMKHFEASTGHSWDNLHGPPSKLLTCLRCKGELNVPWTTAQGVGCDPDVAFAHCTGFADKSFRAQCSACKFSVTHSNLRVAQFRRDVQALLKDGLPMPGTLLTLRGTPAGTSNGDNAFPNRLITSGIKVDLLQVTDASQGENTGIESIRNLLERAVKDRWLIRQVNKTVLPSRLSHTEGIFIRRMMAGYWDNTSLFSLDLTGAVIRQGAFIEKIQQFNWLQSPNIASIVSGLIAKYGVFLDIMIQNPDHVAVPTLDVDFAWHTHQLSPACYYAYSTHHTGGTLIDHDDKVDENRISDAFEWTGKQYQKLTGGQNYSECPCWYCEAIRESQNRRLSSLISRTNNHDVSSGGMNGDFEGNGRPHISSHNSVRVQGQASHRATETKAEALKKDLSKARRRSQMAGNRMSWHSIPERDDRDNVETDIPSSVSIWGVPCNIPHHGPYMRDPEVHEDIYPSNPLCLSVAPGAPGNCVAGTDRQDIGKGGCVSAAPAGEPSGKHRGGRAGFCQGIAGDAGGGAGMF